MLSTRIAPRQAADDMSGADLAFTEGVSAAEKWIRAGVRPADVARGLLLAGMDMASLPMPCTEVAEHFYKWADIFAGRVDRPSANRRLRART